MTITPEKAVHQLRSSLENGELTVIIGTGVSIALTDNKIPALSWTGLIKNGLNHGEAIGKISAAQHARRLEDLGSPDLDDLLGAAEFVGGKLGAPDGDLYGKWLRDVFKEVEPLDNPMAAALKTLAGHGAPLATLNYDPLLGKLLNRQTLTLGDKAHLADWMRGKNTGVLHLHGVWDKPQTCVLGVRDYDRTLGDEFRQLVQRQLGGFRQLLFIGCGDTFADPNFANLIGWLRKHAGSAPSQHFALTLDGEVDKRLRDESLHGFVQPLGFGPAHGDLPEFLSKLFPATTAKSPSSAPSRSAADPDHAAQLEAYRQFILRDCGSTTVEGLNPGMDLASRRFRLEEIFVPLEVLPADPPEIADDDPKREAKLRRWEQVKERAQFFGARFKGHPHMALLALPGGGKTMLLKRLTAAYADPQRLRDVADHLPKLDLYPVLIRCRDWRDHIRLPISTLLRKLDEVTGQAGLRGFDAALAPLLQSGKVLLLVDGLDEIHDDGDRQTFVGHLATFIQDHPKTRLVVTSREAGFSIIAPKIAGFCDKWRLAPLSESAIGQLCRCWHRLTASDPTDADQQGEETAARLIEAPALRRLAENPLLLTMLLVVQHGGGGVLPADRVTLYHRAVEVLLDTWNVQGHPQLRVKEAAPQLAFVAYEMMRAGKQTVTESELLELLVRARDEAPRARHFAVDPPDVFLKRVELRSSLLVEVGRREEGGRTTPFYQFRHLTFQEYLAAVAVVEGHTPGYRHGDNILKPLQDYLTAEEWKEVVPMTAALAKNNAEPLLAALVAEGEKLRQALTVGEDFAGKQEWRQYPVRFPAPVTRLAQCLLEEASPSPNTLQTALELILFFARGGYYVRIDWVGLFAGPYSADFWRIGWAFYLSRNYPKHCLLRQTLTVAAAARRPPAYWGSGSGVAEVAAALGGDDEEAAARALLAYCGVARLIGSTSLHRIEPALIERWLNAKHPAVIEAAVDALGWLFVYEVDISSTQALDRLLTLWLGEAEVDAYLVAETIGFCSGLQRGYWSPKLTPALRDRFRSITPKGDIREIFASLVVAFHARNVWTDEELAERINREAKRQHRVSRRNYIHMLRQLGPKGEEYARRLEKSRS